MPVDSEHSAIAQALRSGDRSEVRRLVLTASGGPFRGRSRESLADVTPAEALAHPTWDMGRVVTTNSATLVNKGLEVIEAHLLFGVAVPPHRRRRAPAVDRPLDGRVRRRVDDRAGVAARHAPADLARPGLAATGSAASGEPIDWTVAASWTFEPLDDEAFPAVDLAKKVGRAGGTYPAVFNAANEQAVDAFHEGRLTFLGIVELIERVVESHEPESGPVTRASLAEAERWARDAADRAIAAG